MDASTEKNVLLRDPNRIAQCGYGLLNDPSFYGRLKGCQNNNKSAQTNDQRINIAFQKALSRKPDDVERNIINKLIKDITQESKNHDDDKELYCWTSVARVIFNFSEFNTRN